jgi:hemerythrin superfamily protein
MYLIRNIAAIVLIIITLTVVSFHTITGKLYAIEKANPIEGIDEEKCNEIYNCKIITKDVFKYPDIVDPFDNNDEKAKTAMNNINDTKIIEEQSCHKLMDVEIEKKKDQKIGEQIPNFMICLP